MEDLSILGEDPQMTLLVRYTLVREQEVQNGSLDTGVGFVVCVYGQ